jgi:hypothetical protein
MVLLGETVRAVSLSPPLPRLSASMLLNERGELL